MTSDAYKAALQKAKAEFSNAIKQRDHWNLEIARLRQLVNGLAASVEKKKGTSDSLDSSNAPQVGITQMVQSVIGSGSGPMSASDVRDALQATGYDLSEYSNPLALIHQTLKRLAADGRIVDQRNGNYCRKSLFYG